MSVPHQILRLPVSRSDRLSVVLVISPPWPSSTRPLPIWTDSSRPKSYNYSIRSSTVPPSSPFGQCTPSGLVSWAPVYGSSPTSVAIKRSRNPSPLIMPSVGCYILGGCMPAYAPHLHSIDPRGLDWAFHITRGVSPTRSITRLPATWRKIKLTSPEIAYI